MNKKLLACLAPLLATAAFAVMPAASQAACTPPNCPHLYKNHVPVTEGVHLRTFGWGTVKLNNPTLGQTECRNIIGDYLENPVGGGAVVGKVGGEPYDCMSQTCTALGGTEIDATEEGLQWPVEVTEPSHGVFRMNIRNILFRLNCVGVVNTQFSGEWAPKEVLPNTCLSIGAGTELEFDQPASGELHSVSLGGLQPEGRYKIQGYAAQECLEFLNP
jgi:hypothetical protein